MTNPTVTNPIIVTVPLDKYGAVGWVMHVYADGTFDSTDNKALSPVFDTPEPAIAFARS